jgi:hypothetical protein
MKLDFEQMKLGREMILTEARLLFGRGYGIIPCQSYGGEHPSDLVVSIYEEKGGSWSLFMTSDTGRIPYTEKLHASPSQVVDLIFEYSGEYLPQVCSHILAHYDELEPIKEEIRKREV